MKPTIDTQAILAAQMPLKEHSGQGQTIPFQIGDTVRYVIPDPQDSHYKPGWVKHTGRVQEIDQSAELALLIPETEPGLDWRWVPLIYVRPGTL